MSSHPWIVTSEPGFVGNNSLRKYDEKTGTYVIYVSGPQHKMKFLADMLNEKEELEAGVIELAEAAEEVAIEDEKKLPHVREFAARETIRQIKCVVQSWDDMALKSREAMESIKHIMKEREE